ncbi:DEAD/DEAH box helicase [Terrihalobacillus insolitus]|uniref:DEAD/DEAH box helicase n=1 Tax=Terrihalobacillus insolitus TaxID=2950438 RepID=UPI002340FF3D|nr:DEAD/DEAH box helicase family protein [Terrihalobacillus insolitus]MDC3413910.1 DEAD/DEAH box helicase family protein [Terrihalobacillus insolitus]
MLDLKTYQKRSIKALSDYLKLSRTLDSGKEAFEKIVNRPYCGIPHLSEAMPYVCVRIPTGGGKTLVASHSINSVMKDFLHRDQSLVLWLVPTNPILNQTLETLRDVTHPYRKALEESIDTPITVLTIQEALYLQKNILDNETVIIVSTLAALRIEDTTGRKVYDDNAHLKPLLDGLSEGLMKNLERTSGGERIKYSLANVLQSRMPTVIIDEAHNARTMLSFETLSRFNPSAIVEFTATPHTTHNPENGEYASNVIYNVSAAELFAEDMIKMPIRLETRTDWKDAIRYALAKRKELEIHANKLERNTGEYIRPIALLQAQPTYQNRDSINVEKVYQSLIDDFRIPKEEIAIATGDKNEIKGVNLNDSDCKIKFIITVSALKEGWDCPFAYVLCSVAEIGSSTAVEQLVGRVLRMPKAKKKNIQELNRAYAYVSSQRFADTLKSLTDALVENGFTPFEAKTMIVPPTPEEEEEDLFNPNNYSYEKETEENPKLDSLPTEIKTKVDFNPEKRTFTYKGSMSEEEKEEIKKCFETDEGKNVVDDLFQASNSVPDFTVKMEDDVEPVHSQTKKDTFKVPKLMYSEGGLFRDFEESIFLEGSWKLSENDPTLTEKEFSTKSYSAGQVGEITVTEEGRLKSKFIDDLNEQLNFNISDKGWSIAELANWIDRKIHHPDITMRESTLYIYKVIEYLIDERKIDLQTLAFFKYKLRNSLEKLIDKHRKNYRREAFQACLDFDDETLLVRDEYALTYDEEIYPFRWAYDGDYEFNKHYYKNVGELKTTGEELYCAKKIDSLSEVKHWVRNLEHDPSRSFWLQRSHGKFYPDFVAELNDGRILVVEYKGDHLKNDPDEKEKKAIGELWAARSNGKCLFYWALADNVDNLKDFILNN